MELNEAIQEALDGKALLFVGAGFSLGAKDLSGSNFITGGALAELLSRECGLTSNIPLEDASELYQQKFGTDKLIEFLRNKFTASEICSFHRNIAQIPWSQIYTTNYDNIIEKAYKLEHRNITPITLESNIYNIPKKHTICIHLNGYIDRLDRETIFNELKLTETSYITSSIENSPWITEFKYEIELANAVFFLGFSLYDLDIKRILNEFKSLRDKCFFIIGRPDNELTKMRVSRYGTPLNISVQDFSDLINEERKNYVPIERSNFSTLSIIEHSSRIERKPFSDKDFLDFLMYGKYEKSQILESIISKQKFYLERHQIANIFAITEKGGKVCTVSSNFGNGKSLFLEGLHQKFLEKGFRVFSVNEHSIHTKAELKQIAQLEEKVLITFENYGRWFDEIELFCMNSTDNTLIVLTERSANHDIVIDTLLEKIGNRELYEEDLNILNQTEIDWFLDVFETYGFWGEYAGESFFKKRNYLMRNCKSQIHAILLSLLDSPNIKDKLRQISDEVKRNNTHFDILLSIFILTIMNHQPTLSLLSDIWGAEIINRTNFRKDKVIRQFIDFGNDEIVLKSPILSEYFVTNFVDANKIVSVLHLLARVVSKLKLSNRYKDLFKSLVRFSNIQSIFPEKGLRQGAIAFYESIKNLPECKTYPLFWLQYAIACTTTREIVRAKKYFETAYSFANEKQWDLFQIDNHYARFLLVEAIESLTLGDAMDNFRRSHNINKRQIDSRDRKNYPFRVASSYRPFFDKFNLELSTPTILN